MFLFWFLLVISLLMRLIIIWFVMFNFWGVIFFSCWKNCIFLLFGFENCEVLVGILNVVLFVSVRLFFGGCGIFFVVFFFCVVVMVFGVFVVGIFCVCDVIFIIGVFEGVVLFGWLNVGGVLGWNFFFLEEFVLLNL